MKHTKPFNLEHAKAGAPYACRNGNPASVLKWDAKGSEFTLIGFVDRDGAGNEIPESWIADGSVSATRDPRNHDLVMLPLGEIDGRPVFVGDELETNGFGDGWKCVTVHPGDHGFTTCRWPNAKQYPTTQMHMADFDAALAGSPYNFELGAAVRIANAALRHAIDHGQVVTREEFDRAVGDRKARDTAIAEAVRAHLMRLIAAHSYGAHDYCLPRVNLPTIIEQVKP